MAPAFLSKLNPINSFPPYSGPYQVGTVDVELPAADLPLASAAPSGSQPTVAFRLFYPCKKHSREEPCRPVRWIPRPQRPYLIALLKFLGVRERLAGVASYLFQHVYWIKLRACRNAKLLEPPTSNARWPVTFFSHGLAGDRNAYSYICGDLASSGVVVVALDHRDGSSPLQHVRATADTEARTISSITIPYKPTHEVYEARDKQLRIRLWEMSMAYEALMKIDDGQKLQNLDSELCRRGNERVDVLQQFEGKFDIQRAGKVTWAGHSFGSSTIMQLIKSIYYAAERPPDSGTPLISSEPDAAIAHQITSESPLLLLDMWGFPLQSPAQAYLWDKPLPVYTTDDSTPKRVLCVFSERFYKWKNNLKVNEHEVGPPSESQDHSPSRDSGYHSPSSTLPGASTESQSRNGADATESSNQPRSERTTPTSAKAYMFYVPDSQHFNQSDFGVLFPTITRHFAKVKDPAQILNLNHRAMVQVMREAGIEVAGKDDPEILDTNAGIDRWIAVPVENEPLKTGGGVPKALDRDTSIVPIVGPSIESEGKTNGQPTEASSKAT